MATQKEHPISPTVKNIAASSVGSCTQVMSPKAAKPDDAGNDSHDLAPQAETSDEITLSGQFDDLNVLAEHTQKIRQLLREPVSADDFVTHLEFYLTWFCVIYSSLLMVASVFLKLQVPHIVKICIYADDFQVSLEDK
ncbi:hypothetical protein MTO96_037358 [Rhipicephalus appendiculatus]